MIRRHRNKASFACFASSVHWPNGQTRIRKRPFHDVTTTKQGRAVAVLISIERMEAIGETMELLVDPNAMSAIRKHREGAAFHVSVALWLGS